MQHMPAAHLEGEAHVALDGVGRVAEQQAQAAVHIRMHIGEVVEAQRRAEKLPEDGGRERQVERVAVVDREANDHACVQRTRSRRSAHSGATVAQPHAAAPKVYTVLLRCMHTVACTVAQQRSASPVAFCLATVAFCLATVAFCLPTVAFCPPTVAFCLAAVS
jgi:hypothetical protein